MELKQGEPIQKIDNNVNYSPPVKSRLPFIIILTLIIVIILGTSFYLGLNKVKQDTEPAAQTQSQPTTFISPTPTIDPTANWKTYLSQTFSIRYPSNWDLRENNWENQKYVVLSDNPDASANTFTIDIYENSQMDQTTDYILHYYVNSTAGLADRHPKEISKTRVNIAEVEADKYIYKLDEQQEFPYNESTVIIFQYGQDSYVFKVSGKDQKILNQILSTFQFLDQSQIAADETANWQTYTSSSEKTWSFKYPENWTITEYFEGGPKLSGDYNNHSYEITVNYPIGYGYIDGPPSNLTLDDWVQHELSYLPPYMSGGVVRINKWIGGTPTIMVNNIPEIIYDDGQTRRYSDILTDSLYIWKDENRNPVIVTIKQTDTPSDSKTMEKLLQLFFSGLH